ncbi:hypothetical protein V8D89_008597 [Ganoderma adspersum]
MAFSALAAAGWHPQTSWQGRLLDIRVRQLVCSAALAMLRPQQTCPQTTYSRLRAHKPLRREAGLDLRPGFTLLPTIMPDAHIKYVRNNVLKTSLALVANGARIIPQHLVTAADGRHSPWSDGSPVGLRPQRTRSRCSHDGCLANPNTDTIPACPLGSTSIGAEAKKCRMIGLKACENTHLAQARRNQGCKAADESRFGDPGRDPGSGLSPQAAARKYEIRGVRSVLKCFQATNVDICGETGVAVETWWWSGAKNCIVRSVPPEWLVHRRRSEGYIVSAAVNAPMSFRVLNLNTGARCSDPTILRPQAHADSEDQLSTVQDRQASEKLHAFLSARACRVRAVRPGQAASVFAGYMLVLCVENTVEDSTECCVPARQLRASRESTLSSALMNPRPGSLEKTTLRSVPAKGLRAWCENLAPGETGEGGEKRPWMTAWSRVDGDAENATRTTSGQTRFVAVPLEWRTGERADVPAGRNVATTLGPRLGGSVARCTPSPAGESSSKNGRPDPGKDMAPAPEAGEVVEVTESGATARRPGLRRQPVRSGRTAHVRVSHRVVSSAGGHADVTKHRVLRRKMRIVSRHRPETPRTFLSNRLCSSSSSRSATDGLLNAGRFGGARDSNGGAERGSGQVPWCPMHARARAIRTIEEGDSEVVYIACMAAILRTRRSRVLCPKLGMLRNAWPGSSLDSSEAGDNAPSGVRVGMKGSGVSTSKDVGTTLARARARADDAGGKPTVDTDRLEELRMAAR